MNMHSLTRRTFTKSAVVASASFALDGFSQTVPSQRRVGIAPIGLGSCAEVFMRSVGKSENAKLTGLVTGHPAEKGKKFAAMYGVADSSIYTYETFDSIRDNHDIEAVYVALPNSMHCEYTIRAAEAGKHVFCEKPMAISSIECKRMIDACRHAGVKLMIGYRLHHEPVFLKLHEMVRSGAFGEILQFQAGFYGMKNKQEWRLNRALAGGGSMFDLGVYALNTIRWFSGEEPVEFRTLLATRDKTGKFSSVEETVNCLLKFPSGILAEFGSSYGQSGTNYFQINGTTGHVRVEPAFTYGDSILKYDGKTESGDLAGSGAVYDPDQFVTEVTHFANCILQNIEPATPGEEGMKDLLSVEEIYRAVGSSRA
jgi:predicted dehydrogenase